MTETSMSVPPGETPVHLPRAFRFAHEFAFDLHDVLASMVCDGESHGCFNVEVDVSGNPEARRSLAAEDSDTWGWMEKHGYDAELSDLVARQIFVALLADMCNFIYEALCCSAKGKLTVAYSLLRKPLKDNLFYLEWLLADREGFVERFRNGEIGDVDHPKAFATEDAKRQIIRKAMGKTVWGTAWLGDDLVYGLRYAKQGGYGFEGDWNQATHLITTNRHYRTEKTNFNFVFSSDEDRNEQWSHLYFQLPILLMHTVEIAAALFSSFAAIDEDADSVRRFRRVVGFLIWSDLAFHAVRPNSCLHELREVIGRVGAVHCEECDSVVGFKGSIALRFYRKGVIRCSCCGNVSDIEEEPLEIKHAPEGG